MGGEAVLFTPTVALALARIATLLLIPVMPILAVLRALRLFSPASTRWSPMMEYAALGVGVLAVPVVLATCSMAEMLGFGEIFASGGPWDLGFRAFLFDRALPLWSAPFGLLSAVASGRAGGDIAGATFLLGSVAVALMLAPLMALRSRAGVAASLRNAALVLWGAYAGIYAVVMLAWVAHLLNFWCFLVLFVALSWGRD